MTTDELLPRFENVRQVSGGWSARCPAHEDETASLSISTTKGGSTLLHCHAGCETEAIVGKLGLQMRDLFSGSNGKASAGKKIVATYDYRDEAGTLLYQVVRYNPKDFRQRAPKDGGGWNWKLGDTRRVLYRLPELLAADPAAIIYIVEGEKDVDRLVKLGLIATTNVGGAGKWRPDYNQRFVGRNVVILTDNDSPGRKHGGQVGAALKPVAASIKVVELPGLSEKGDVSDWLDAGGTAEQLQALVAATQEWSKSAPTISAEITNATIVFEDEKSKQVEPIRMAEIIRAVAGLTGGELRRVGNALFIHSPGKPLDWLESTSALFGWLQTRCGTVIWERKTGCVTKDELFAELRRQSPQYDAIEDMPHWPPIKDHFYACPLIEPGDGAALQNLLDKFQPATDIDRDLILSAMMTPLWGGPPGCRPCFTITSDDGRGAGKSTLANLVGELFGGTLTFSHLEDIGKIKTRLLSPAALPRRICLLDNVKSLKFSWSDLEAMITAVRIGGHRLYSGEGTRPNTLTWFVTLNGASLSTDLAQRCVIIKLAKPSRSATWEESTRLFVRDHRNEILSDLAGVLSQSIHPLASFTRWATWERDILQRLPEPGEAQKVILERQGEADTESEEIEIVEDFFAEQLQRLGYEVDGERVFISTAIAARWFGWATNQKVTTGGAGRILTQLITEGRANRLSLSPCRSHGRGYIWWAPGADVSSRLAIDLEQRIRTTSQAS